MSFNDDRSGTGTREWAEVTHNICIGCANGCRYCYAAHNANRFGKRLRDDWQREEFTKRAFNTSFGRCKGVVMFPSSHDITPFNVEQYVRSARMILAAGNRLLVVSKPRKECIEALLDGLEDYKDQVMLRFTIGTMNSDLSRFWEPGAPEPYERAHCLDISFLRGFRTSVSIEPIIGGILDAMDVVRCIGSSVTDTIWIGKMNNIRARVDMSEPEVVRQVEAIEAAQTDVEILRLVALIFGNPLIRWKDSIKKVIDRHNSTMEALR